ncbi:MAG: MoxR family ATPase, partial [Gammaproteobacteria bacterium]
VFEPEFHDVDELLERVSRGILPWTQLNDIGATIQRSVRASEALERYVLDLWEATQNPEKFGVRIEGVDMRKLILAGASPRGMMALTRAARVVAWLAGRTHLIPADIHSVAPSVLGHRVFFTPVYELRRSEIAEQLVTQILEKVPTPRAS